MYVHRTLPYLRSASAHSKRVAEFHSFAITKSIKRGGGTGEAKIISERGRYLSRQSQQLFSSKNDNDDKGGSNISFSSSDGDNDDGGKNTGPLFPWRENATTPLERIAMNDDLSGFRAGQPGSKLLKKLASSMELKEFGLWSFFVTKSWEGHLANQATLGFLVAVCGLVGRTFGIRQDDIMFDYHGATIDVVAPGHGRDNENNADADADADADAEELLESTDNENDSDNTNSDNDGEREISPLDGIFENDRLQAMMEENVLSLYKPIPPKDGGRYHVTLGLRPIGHRLENIFLVPGLTRQDVNNNPSLKGAYQAIEKVWAEKGSMDDIREMSKELIRKTSHFGHNRSIIMDVSMDFMEIFQIKDLEKGVVVQGQRGSGSDDEVPEPQFTTHVVRLEMVTSKGLSANDRVTGSWYITDIDDMLGGNIWH